MARPPIISEFQKFKMERVKRTELRDAPYNPRQIDENARRKLRHNIKKVGLIQPIIWNKRTGHIVAGHQRLTILDVLERTENYSLDVAVVDFDENTEKEQVVFLNNELAMGSFDLPKLDTLLRDISFEACGFDRIDLEVTLPSFQISATSEAEEQDREINELAEGAQASREKRRNLPDPESPEEEQRLEEMRAHKANVRAQGKANHPEGDDVEFFIVLVFPNRQVTEEFLDQIHVDRSEKYISGVAVAELLPKQETAVAQSE